MADFSCGGGHGCPRQLNGSSGDGILLSEGIDLQHIEDVVPDVEISTGPNAMLLHHPGWVDFGWQPRLIGGEDELDEVSLVAVVAVLLEVVMDIGEDTQRASDGEGVVDVLVGCVWAPDGERGPGDHGVPWATRRVL